MSRRRSLLLGVAAAGSALAAVATRLAAESPDALDTWSLIVVGVSVLLPFAVGAELIARYPQRRLGWLSIAIGLGYFVRAGAFAQSPILYSLSRALGPMTGVLLAWLMLAFPSGRLGSRVARVVVAAGALSVALLWWPAIALAPSFPPSREAFAVCGEHCPQNVFLLADRPDLSGALTTAFRASGAVLLAVTALILVARLLRATRLTRRMLAPVLVASIARSAVVSSYVALGTPPWIRELLILTYWATLASISVGLLRGRSYDASALEQLVHGLRLRPGPGELQTLMARALDDPSLEIAYWIPQAALHASAGGEPMPLPGPGSARARTPVADARDRHVATLLHDPALLDHPELLGAVASTSVLALESLRLEAEMAAARGGVIVAVEEERRRIERDLHDGAQQRLIAIRMKLSAVRHLLERDALRARALLGELDEDADAALAELRALAHGTTPPLLRELGIVRALDAIARGAPLPVRIRSHDVGRYPLALESAVYFACAEAIQNAAKHAGAGASVEVEIRGDDDALTFSVSDDGRGFADAGESSGAGLRNLRDRIRAVGGRLEVESRVGGGTRIAGSIPV